jgi:hypothetical protein
MRRNAFLFDSNEKLGLDDIQENRLSRHFRGAAA